LSTEGDEAAVVLEDALGAESGAIEVSGEVLEGGLAPADRSHIGHPIHEQDWMGHLGEQSSIGRGMWAKECRDHSFAHIPLPISDADIFFGWRPVVFEFDKLLEL